MIKYARTQAEVHQVHDRVEFHVMDALGVLDLPAAFFDLVNLRFGVSYVRTWDWLKLLSELLRITRMDGVVRLTDVELMLQSNSPALTRLFEMLQCAFFRGGHLFTDESTGLINHLTQLLDQYGGDQVQMKLYDLEYRAGTTEGEAFCEDMMLAFQNARPFIQKWACASKDYEAIYQRLLEEMRQPDFLATLNILSAWGSKPRPRSQQSQQ